MSNARPSDIFNLCQYQFAGGRLCGLPAHPKGDGLCLVKQVFDLAPGSVPKIRLRPA